MSVYTIIKIDLFNFCLHNGHGMEIMRLLIGGRYCFQLFGKKLPFIYVYRDHRKKGLLNKWHEENPREKFLH